MRPGRTPGMSDPCFLKVLSRVVRVEHHGGVEVREEHDEDHVEDPVEPTAREGACNGLDPAHAGEEDRDLRREVQQRAGEDNGDHAGGVDLDRKVGGLAAHDATTLTTRLA